MEKLIQKNLVLIFFLVCPQLLLAQELTGYLKCVKNGVDQGFQIMAYWAGGIVFLSSDGTHHVGGGCNPDGDMTPKSPTAKYPGNGPISCGSAIDVGSRAIKESVRIVGTPFSLVYSSSYGRRAAEYQTKFKACSHDLAPGGLPDCRATYQVGSTAQSNEYVGKSNEYLTFNWNRMLSSGKRSFFPIEGTYTQTYLNLPGGMSALGDIPNIYTFIAGTYDALFYGLGGWQFDVHHAYSFINETLYTGYGKAIYAKATERPDGNWQVLIDEDDLVYIFSSDGKHLKTVTKLLGKPVYTFKYDNNGRLVSITDAYNKATIVQRNSAGKPISIKAPFGQITNLTLNANGFITSLKDPSNKNTTMTYVDANGLLKSFAKPGQSPTNFSYDSLGYLKKDLHPSGRSLTYAEISSEPLTISEATAMGRLSTVEIWDVAHGTASYVHTSSGGFISQVSSDGYVSTVTSTPTWESTIFRDFDTRFQDNYRIVTETNRSSGYTLQTSSQYEESFNLANPDDPFSVISAIFSENRDDNLWKTNFSATTSTFETISPKGRKSSYKIDNNERITSISKPGINSFNYYYNTLGQLTMTSQGTRKSNFSYNNLGYLATVKNSLSQTTSFEYDESGRQKKINMPGNTSIEFGYDDRGNVVSIKPPTKAASIFSWNSFDNLNQFSPPLLGPTSTPTLYKYNLDQQLTQITRADGQIIKYLYGSSNGTLEQIEHPQGAISVTMDSENRLTSFNTDTVFSSRFFDGPLITAEYTSHFDAASRYVFGFLTNGFHPDGKLASQEISDPNTSRTLSLEYRYDEDRLLTQVGPQTMTYNGQNGLLTKINNGKLAISLGYNAFGEIISYNAKYGTQVLYSYTLTRDGLGRVTKKIESIQGSTKDASYTYDSLGRLKTVKEGATITGQYNYDGNGNRTSGKLNNVTFTATYDEQDRLKIWNSYNFTYNKNGELISKVNSLTLEKNEFTYNPFGNLKSFKKGSSVINYTLDGLGRRLGRGTGPTINGRYIYEGDWKIIGEFNTDNTPKRIYGYGSHPHSPDLYKQGTEFYQILKDHLGSVRLVVRISNGQIMQRLDYNEWGKIINAVQPQIQPLAFAGGLYDSSSMLVHFGARDYDPETGRWLSKDPIGFAGGDTNLYGYTFNDPINYIDPRGTDADVYIGFPFPHGVIRIDDPSSSTGSTYFDFYPPNGGGIFGAVPGEVGSGSSYYGGLIPRSHYDLTPAQDLDLLNRARQIQEDARNGSYPYSTLGPKGKNCYGFINDVCGKICK